MAIQIKESINSGLRAMIDMLFVVSGVVFGAIVALIGLWLWLDYQVDPAHSTLAFISSQLVALLPVSMREYFGQQAQMMGLPLTRQTPAYWYMARAGGVVAYLLMWLSTVWGLTLSSKVLNKVVPASIAYGLHEFLSFTALLFAALHAAVLLGDSYIEFNIFHLTVPFIAPYEPLWTGLGIIAFYLALVMTGSFYVRHLIGQKTWRWLHYLTFLAYLLALLHGITSGTDRSLLGMKLMYLGTGSSVLFLIYYRLFTLKQPRLRHG